MTRDGSPSLESHRWGCAFHSRHGALTEALHVYLQEGLAHVAAEVEGPLRLLEMGAGTGFNAALALDWAQRQGRELHYTGIDVALPDQEAWEAWRDSWPQRPSWMERAQRIRDAWAAGQRFLEKGLSATYVPGLASEVSLPSGMHCVFYDAFSPTQQPELWTSDALAPWLDALHPQGYLVTYCARGHVFRAVRALGYRAEHVQGPPGKREMLRASVVSHR